MNSEIESENLIVWDDYACRRFEDRLHEHTINAVTYKVCLPLTFTPFASAKACSARCVFCSESLCHKDASKLSASLRPDSNYFEGLNLVLEELKGLPLGISLSGLEATDDADWLCAVLDALSGFEANGGVITEKILYTNSSGLARKTNGARLLPRLRNFGLDRAEVSRHHYDETRNQKIMRFRDQEGVCRQSVFCETVGDIINSLQVKLVCLLQKSGVDSVKEMENYLEFAASLGVKEVVFREFSRTQDLYRENATLRAIENERVEIASLISNLLSDERLAADFCPISRKRGYYYWNTRFKWRGLIDVVFEASDYQIMKSKHKSGTLHKLIYHANGNLSGDWDPETCVLMRTANGK